MDPLITAALASWSPRLSVLALLFCVGLIYWRGWRRGRRLLRSPSDASRLAAFLAGLLTLGLALESPLDALDGLLLSAHMTQHLLLLMVAPPLLLFGQPTLPLLRGLPRRFVKDGTAPFLTWQPLRTLARALTAMPFAWLLFAVSTLLWHLPGPYERALHSPGWHGFQHACFFWTGVLFWWPVILQEPAKRRWPEWTLIPYLLFADIVNTALSAFFIFSGKVLYPSYQALHVAGFSPQDDQALAGAIMWVPGSLVYLLPAVVFAMRLLSPRTITAPSQMVRVRHVPVVRCHPWTRRLPMLRRTAQIILLLLAIVVVADGFLGTSVAPLNLAGVLPWIHWRALSLVALLTVGNLFCASCPFVLVRDMGRRILPARWRWPRVLRNKWLPIGLLLLYLWAYEALSLWDKPAITAWLIVAYFAAALFTDGFFRGASFCKYVCPIGQFHFVTSLVSPREVRIRRQNTCVSCQTHDCIRGNASARGCELYLFQPKKQSNLDCTFCMDCIRACPHDNVALLPVLPGETLLDDGYRSSLGRLSVRSDYAALALLITFGGLVNAAGMTGPVMMWEHRWHARLGPHGMAWAVAAFVLLGGVVLPLFSVALCGLFNRLVHAAGGSFALLRRFAFAAVPLGAAVWAAHLAYHFVTSWRGSVPLWLTSLQLLLLDGGLLLTWYLDWKLANQAVSGMPRAFAIWAPWATLALALYAAGVWTFLQPMNMRGMMQ